MCFPQLSLILLQTSASLILIPQKCVLFSGDGEEDEVEGETESVASSQQHEQQDGESRGERSHLIVWQVTLQD